MANEKILIIDDDRTITTGVAAILRRENYQVCVAHSGLEGLRTARAERPDLILSDVMMPKPNGFELRRQLAWYPEVAETPFIFISALTTLPDRLAGLTLGADDYLPKPFNKEELLARVASVLRRYSAGRQRGRREGDVQFERFVELSPDGVLLVDAEGTVQLANSALARLLGADSPPALIGRKALEFVAPAQQPQYFEQLNQVIQDAEHTARLETVFIDLAGGECSVEITVSHFNWMERSAAQVTVRDIRARLAAEAALRRRDNILQAAAAAAEHFLMDADWQRVAPALLEQLGQAASASRAYIGVIHRQPDGRELAKMLFAWSAPNAPAWAGLAQGAGQDLNAQGLLPWVDRLRQGETLAAMISDFPNHVQAIGQAEGTRAVIVMPILDRGQLWGVFGVDDCTTDRVWQPPEIEAVGIVAKTLSAALQRERIQRELRGQQDRLAGIIDFALTGIITIDEAQRIVVFNPAAEEIFGCPAAAALGQTLEQFLPATARAGHARSVQGFRDNAASTRCAMAGDRVVYGRRATGEEFPMEASISKTTVAGQRLLTVIFQDVTERHRSQQALQDAHWELATAYDATLAGWSRALDLRDKETQGHSERVTDLAVRVAAALGLDQDALINIRRGALLHDIGKMGIPDRILLKPGPLTEDEWQIMRLHPQYALEMLAPIEYLGPALEIPYGHHEKWDGSGYPRGLKGPEIPLAARIFAVVDVWDALTSDRPYRAAWPRDKTLAYLQKEAGKQFDPQIVEAFGRLMPA